MRTSIDRRAARAITVALGLALAAATAAAETSDGQGTPQAAAPRIAAPGGTAQIPPRAEVSLRVGLVPPLYRNGAGQIVDPRLGTPIPGQGDPK